MHADRGFSFPTGAVMSHPTTFSHLAGREVSAWSEEWRHECEVASVLTKRGCTWFAELLNSDPEASKPAPFTEVEHAFLTMGEACDWMGVVEIED